MFLRASTKTTLENSLGLSIADLAAMDYEQELSFVKSKSGRMPRFSKEVDFRIAARGNHLLAQRRIMTIDDVNEQILGWKKDDRKF